MLNEDIGNIIKKLRIEKGLTQKQLGDKMNISDKAISKWERGLGIPDVSLLAEISDILEVNIQNLLKGELLSNDFVGGNMRKSKFFVCPICGNVAVCTGTAELSCCGRKLEALEAKKAAEGDKLNIEEIENEWFISSPHPMTKEHHIPFVAFATGGKIEIIKQYPEWDLQLRIQRKGHGTLFWYCNIDGLFYQMI